jgi:hypothetical protein
MTSSAAFRRFAFALGAKFSFLYVIAVAGGQEHGRTIPSVETA